MLPTERRSFTINTPTICEEHFRQLGRAQAQFEESVAVITKLEAQVRELQREILIALSRSGTSNAITAGFFGAVGGALIGGIIRLFDFVSGHL